MLFAIYGTYGFRGSKALASGANTLTVTATDASNNTTTLSTPITTGGIGMTGITYDLAGNQTGDGTNTYSWDARSQLVQITYPGTGNRTEFTYDGWGRRVRIKEWTNNAVSDDRRFVWDGLSLAERRDGSYAVQMRYYGEGFSSGIPGGPTVKNLYRRDHLGSVREVVDENGGVTRQEFDLWGVRSGNNTTSDFGFTGHYSHRRSELALAPYRAYSPAQARWLSRDPIEEAGGMNLYGYVLNQPTTNIDWQGLDNLNIINPYEYRSDGTLQKDFLEAAPVSPNEYSVAGHGNPDYMLDEEYNRLSPEALADRIKKDPKYDRTKPVRLNACATGGKTADGSPNFAQRLAKELDNTVIAPTENIGRGRSVDSIKFFRMEFNKTIKYRTVHRNGGCWKEFH